MEIKRFDEVDDRLGEFINKEFSAYGEQNGVFLNYDEFCFAAEEDGNILGVITGRAYYNEVHIGDLIVASSLRKGGIGSKLVRAVEDNYRGKGYDKITLRPVHGSEPPRVSIQGQRRQDPHHIGQPLLHGCLRCSFFSHGREHQVC